MRPPRRRRPRTRTRTRHSTPPYVEGIPVVDAVGEVPRPLYLYSEQVWDDEGDVVRAASRWRAAAGRWRTAARGSGVTLNDVWHAVGAPPPRFMHHDEQRLQRQLEGIRATAADLPAIAAEARSLWPDLFAREGS